MNTRRGILRWIAVGAGSLVSWIPGLMGSRSTSVSAQSPKPTIKPTTAGSASPMAGSAQSFQKVGTLADLKDNQLILKDGFKPGPVLIGQDPKNPKTLVAVNPTCTHAGCDVEWKGDKFSCPCHGSLFGSDGKVSRGPAKDPLPTYTVKLDGENILVAAPKV